MRVIAWSTLAAYGEIHPQTMASLKRWRQAMKAGEWKSMSEAANAMSKAKSVGGDRIRFEIADGFRLIAAFDFEHRIVFVKFIGTHDEYDRIDAATVSQV